MKLTEKIKGKLKEAVKKKRYAATYRNGDRTVYTRANKQSGRWLVGGDVVDQGYKRDISIFSLDDEKIYKLQGSHLVPQDNMSNSQVKWFNDNWEKINTDGISE